MIYLKFVPNVSAQPTKYEARGETSRQRDPGFLKHTNKLDMKIKPLLLLLITSLSTICATAQRITGTVFEANGQPLFGATVAEKGTPNGTITDLDGKFILEIKDAATSVLSIRFVGFEEKEIALAGRTSVEIMLGEDETMLNQVVVVGYGVQKKSDLTGAVGTVKSRDLERVTVGSVEHALQGKIAGVYVQPRNGEPGAAAVIRIRGTGSLNNSAPIFVVDGMITSDANFVNPQDVASVEVLKDASACAIYGARGANGVIIITTKNGKGGTRGQLSLSSYYGEQRVTRTIPMANASEFAQLYNEFKGKNYYPDPASLGAGTDWQNEVFQRAPLANVVLSASGGNEKGWSYNVSGGYFRQEGIVKNGEYERFTMRFNQQIPVKSWLLVGSNLVFTKSRAQKSPDVANMAYRMPPVFAAKDSTGGFTDPTYFGLAIANPAAELFYKKNVHDNRLRGVGNVFADLRFLKNFTFRSNFGVDYGNNQERRITPKFDVSDSQLNREDILNVKWDKTRDWIWEQTLTYDRDFGELHHLNVLAGYTAEQRGTEEVEASRRHFPGTDDDLFYLNAGNDTTQTNTGKAEDEALISMLFRTNYSFKSRYLMTFSMRADQSSRFQPANRLGIFPSIGLGWNLGQEDFVENLGLFDRLKIRASIGLLGNQNSTNGKYPTIASVKNGLYGVFGVGEDLNFGATQISISNPDLRWETTRQTDIGAEVGLFKNRLEIEADFYERLTFDIIAAPPIPDYVGSADDPVVNSARVRNRGWDFTANWRQSVGEHFSWRLGGTFSPVKNEVVKLADGKEEIPSAIIEGDPATKTIVGLPIGSFFGYQVAGVFQDENELMTLPQFGDEKVGDLRFRDNDGDGKLSSTDRVTLGSPIPTMSFGVNLGAEWRGIDVAADVFGVRGNKVFNAKKIYRFGVYNWEKTEVGGWTVDNPSQTVPRANSGGAGTQRVSDYYLESGAFVRLRTVAVGYSLPKKWLDGAKISRCRASFSANNVWTKQAYSGYSPEFSGFGPGVSNVDQPFSVGVDYGGYPVARSWQFGLDLTF